MLRCRGGLLSSHSGIRTSGITLSTPVFRPGEFHGLCSPRGRKESDREWLWNFYSPYSVALLISFLLARVQFPRRLCSSFTALLPMMCHCLSFESRPCEFLHLRIPFIVYLCLMLAVSEIKYALMKPSNEFTVWNYLLITKVSPSLSQHIAFWLLC